MAVRLQGGSRQSIADRQHGEAHLAVAQLGVGVVGTLHVRPQEAGKGDGPPAGGKFCVSEAALRPVAGGDSRLSDRGAEADLQRLPCRVGHLRGDGAHPDQFVQATGVAGELRLLGSAK